MYLIAEAKDCASLPEVGVPVLHMPEYGRVSAWGLGQARGLPRKSVSLRGNIWVVHLQVSNDILQMTSSVLKLML